MNLKTNDKLQKIVVSIIIIFACLVLLSSLSFADVGSFESYDSHDSSWGSSSWDSDSSWSSSSWDSHSSTSDGFLFGLLLSNPKAFIVVVIILIIVGAFKKRSAQPLHTTSYAPNVDVPTRKTEEQIVSEIQAHDELFNKDEIIAWSKDLFVRLQQSWSKRDWSEIRVFETNALFEQHKNQLQGYIDNNTINVMDRICVNYANLYDYRISGDKEILVIKLNSRMQDYIIDATTKKVLKGDPNIERTNSYLLTFERKLGVKTKPGTSVVNTTNCPNCGAPTQITSAGKCEYCGSVITTGEYNWCLSNLERAQY